MVQSVKRAFATLPAVLGLPARHLAPAWIAKSRVPSRDAALELALRSAAIWLFVMTVASFIWRVR